jgi:putative addiction module component (TIGR02574 family)
VTPDLSLDTLSTTEKIALMERLWADLSQRPEELPSPDWRGDVLAERIAAVREGRTAFVDWKDAKQRLRDRLE